MTDEELKALCESNARAITASSEQMRENDKATTAKISNLADVVQAFIAKLDSDGLKVTLFTKVTDDLADEALELEKTVNNHGTSITVLRQDAIKDRQAFREQAEADRAAFKEEMQAARSEWQQSFNAQQEVLQTLLGQMIATNQDVSQAKNNISGLSDRVDDLEERAS